jgi:hypothetical protein
LGKAPTIEFLPSPIDGDSPWQLYGLLLNECNEAARKLEQTLGIEICRLDIETGAEWVVYDPIAKLICEYHGPITVDGLAKINASKPSHRGEIEYITISSVRVCMKKLHNGSFIHRQIMRQMSQ